MTHRSGRGIKSKLLSMLLLERKETTPRTGKVPGRLLTVHVEQPKYNSWRGVSRFVPLTWIEKSGPVYAINLQYRRLGYVVLL